MNIDNLPPELLDRMKANPSYEELIDKIKSMPSPEEIAERLCSVQPMAPNLFADVVEALKRRDERNEQRNNA